MFIVAVMCVLFYFMSMEWYLHYWNPVHPARSATDFSLQLKERFGTRVTHDEMDMFLEEQRTLILDEFNEQIRKNPAFAEIGVYNYNDYFTLWASDDIWGNQYDIYVIMTTLSEPEAYWIREVYDSFHVLQHMWDYNLLYMEEAINGTDWNRRFVQELNESDNPVGFIEATLEQLTAEADEAILRQPIFTELGIFSYEDYWAHYNEVVINDYSLCRDWDIATASLRGAQSDFVGSKLGMVTQFRSFMAEYTRQFPEETALSMTIDILSFYTQELSSGARIRVAQVLETGEYLNIMCDLAFKMTMGYFLRLCTLISLAVLALITPLIATDRGRNVQSLQYTAKLGRRILSRQLAAILVSSVILTTILLAAFGAVFFGITGLLTWREHGITSFLTHITTLIPLTYGGYLLLMTAMAYILSIFVALIAFIISRFSRNLMTSLFKAVPVYIALSYLVSLIFSDGDSFGAFTLSGILYRLTAIPGIEAIVLVVLMVAALATVLLVSRRENKVDVL